MSRSAGFFPYFRPDSNRWAIKYKDPVTRKWREHRIPADLPRPVRTEEEALRYGRAWYDEIKKHPAEPGLPDALGRVTFREFADDWTSGRLATRYPDHVREKKSASDDASRLARYVFPHIGNTALVEFEGPNGLELTERVMSALPPPPKLSRATRRQVAQVVHRILALAVYPAKHLKAHPLPKGFLPKGEDKKNVRAKAYLYPDEDAKLLACAEVPLEQRVLFGFLSREGLRTSEALRLRMRDLDLERGVIYLDENKTDDPREWTLDAGVVEGLKRWKGLRRKGARADDLMFVNEFGRPFDSFDLASDLRAFLRKAGVTRPQLFESSATRRPLVAHDLRATFVTLALANGKTETWVADRTGHKSSQMINAYRRAARTAAELHLGELVPLVEAIPELAEAAEAAPPRAS